MYANNWIIRCRWYITIDEEPQVVVFHLFHWNSMILTYEGRCTKAHFVDNNPLVGVHWCISEYVWCIKITDKTGLNVGTWQCKRDFDNVTCHQLKIQIENWRGTDQSFSSTVIGYKMGKLGDLVYVVLNNVYIEYLRYWANLLISPKINHFRNTKSVHFFLIFHIHCFEEGEKKN